jgi:predicted DNA-binding protein (MmcQ/YjbR family)
MAKPGTTEHFPFDEDTLVFKVGGKIFCMTSLQEWENGRPGLNLKGNPEQNEELREQFSAVRPGYHSNKMHWNTVDCNKDVSDKLLLQMLQQSYDLVYAGLTKKAKQAILDQEKLLEL